MGLLDQSSVKEMTEDQQLLDMTNGWIHESEVEKTINESRWAKNIRLLKGIWEQDELTRSNVRGRSKLFFRKIWSIVWRLVASAYQSFLKNPEHGAFVVEGRGPEDVEPKAKVLQFMSEYYLDRADSEQSLFLQHIWGIQNIFNMGFAGAKMWWSAKDDCPKFKVYPNEQIFPDMTAETKNDMRYIMFRSYMTRAEMVRYGFENIDKADPCSVPMNILRSARYAGHKDPIQTEQENHYPEPGKANGEKKETTQSDLYKVDEWFFRGEDGKIYMMTVNPNKAILKKKRKCFLGKKYPVVLGLCLTEANKLIGEGFPEPLEGPQESYNHLINIRKDNLHLSLNKQKYVNRFGNVDLSSLVNSRAGGVTLMDNTEAVRTEDTPDVTQGSYVEAAQDNAMMEDTSGVTPALQGLQKNEKATTAQININESNAKLDVFMAIIAHTWFKEFYWIWTCMVQKFATDEKVFEVANTRLVREGMDKKDYKDGGIKKYTQKGIYDVDDFDMDIRVKVGLSAPDKREKIQNTLMVMEKAIMSNQSTIALLKTGAIRQEQNVQLFDVAKFMAELMPELGYKNVEKYIVTIQGPPPQQAQGQGTQNDAAIAGGVQPQMGGMNG